MVFAAHVLLRYTKWSCGVYKQQITVGLARSGLTRTGTSPPPVDDTFTLLSPHTSHVPRSVYLKVWSDQETGDDRLTARSKVDPLYYTLCVLYFRFFVSSALREGTTVEVHLPLTQHEPLCQEVVPFLLMPVSCICKGTLHEQHDVLFCERFAT